MSLRIYTSEEIPQGSAEWHAARMGIPTASEFDKLLPGSRGKYLQSRRTYLMQVAGEILLPADLPEEFSSLYTDRGKRLEPEARDMYAFLHGAAPEQVGFATNGRKGCSPDSIIGDNGALEIKSKKPAFLLEAICDDAFVDEHKAQCQGALLVLEREWIDLACYWPGLPLFTKRAYRDEEYIRTLSDEINRFNEEVDRVVEAVRRYGEPLPEIANILAAG